MKKSVISSFSGCKVHPEGFVNHHLHIVNGFSKGWLFRLKTVDECHFKNQGLSLSGGGGRASELVFVSGCISLTKLLIYLLYIYWLLTASVSSPEAFSRRSGTFIKPNSCGPRKIFQSGVWFWNIQMRWNLNEGQLSNARIRTRGDHIAARLGKVYFSSHE